jgi:hypothetical protein
VTLTWAPTSNGGSPITGYTIRVFTGTSQSIVSTLAAAASAKSITVTGLTNGTPYTFDISARSQVGTGAYSKRSLVVIPISTPGIPALNTVTPAKGAATLTWTAPSDNGGAPITSYLIRVYAGTSQSPVRVFKAPASATNFTVTGLATATKYTFDIAARNQAGLGAYSSRSSAP